MTTTQPIRIAALLATALVAACGGSSPSPVAGTPPVTSSKAARGTIGEAATGRITVNGVVLDTRGANIRIEGGQHRPESELRRGMIVKVRGSFDDRNGSATEIEFEDHLKGRVRSVSSTAVSSSVDVGGRTVHVEDSTHVFDDGGNHVGLSGLAPDDRVRVSGFTDDRGRLRATSIERQSRQSSDDSFEMKGFVTGLNVARTGFTLKAAPADAGIAVTVASLAAAIVEGAYVEVHAASAPVGGAVTATSVELEDARAGDEGSEVEIEGIVASGTFAAFTIDGQEVSTSSSTRWENGVPDDLLPGVKVEAEGQLQGGVLVAGKVSFRALVRLQGPATGVTASAYTVLGFTVLRDSFGDESDATPTEGQAIQVRGYPSATGTGIVSTRTHPPSGGGGNRLLLQGLVSSKDGTGGSLVILGVTVATTSGTSYHRHRDEVNDIGKSAFFTLVEASRSVVKARLVAAPAGGAATAEELELEDEPRTSP